MNEVIRQLYDRKSVRVFTDQEIREDIVQEILMAAAMAPTAGNQQLYTIIRVTDQGKKVQLSESCDHQPFIAEGKLVLVFCADCLKWYEAYIYAGCEPRRPGEGDFLLAVEDALIAAQNAVVAAWSHGIGSCYIGDIMENYEVQRGILNLPEYVFPATMVVFGYPTEQQERRKKPERSDLSYLVHENQYRRMKEEELKKMLSVKTASEDYESWIRAFCKRKYQSDFAKEMTRSVREFLKQFSQVKGNCIS
jgi:nitroreductase